jgi:predicted dehydrogenase
MQLTPEQKTIGRDNYYEAVAAHNAHQLGIGRRDFLGLTIAGGGVAAAGAGAMYFGYDDQKLAITDPVRVGVIGTGDEGGVLIGALNPKYVNCVAISEIRPYNVHRAFHGDWASDAAWEARPGLISKFGYVSEDEAKEKIKVYNDYHDLLKNEDVEMIIIALPLHLHASVAIEAMTAHQRGWRKKPLHVLTEKLMAHNVAQCKAMGRVAEEQEVLLAVGHQRHYSILYDNAVKMIQWGLLGELHHIRAQWHRGNLPGGDSWQQPIPGGELLPDGKRFDAIKNDLDKLTKALKSEKDPVEAQKLAKKVDQWKAWNEDANAERLKPENFDYRDFTLGKRKISSMEELCRWRLWERTGGGLMAELGSHQLDAASIFCSALRRDGKKAHPLTCHAVGGRHIFAEDRHAEDHVYCMFEFPGPGYDPKFDVGYYDKYRNKPDPNTGVPGYEDDHNKKIVVTYSSIMGNGYGGYGEVVMGTKGTLILEREKEVMLFKDSDTSTSIGVKAGKGGPTMDTQASGSGGAPKAKAAESSGPVSRGYTEEIEHFAWCLRNRDPEHKPRCRAEVALGDAVIALATNECIKLSIAGKPGYIQFQEAWYDIHSDETPDGSDVKAEYKKMTQA